MNIAERVQELLQKPEYNEKGQNEIAMEIGIAPSVLSRVKNGDSKDPSASTVVAMAKYFNVSADYLLGLSDITSTDVETQDICKKLSCPDEMLPIIRRLFVDFCPRPYVYNIPSDFASRYENNDSLAGFFEYKAEKYNAKNRASDEKTSLEYFVLKSIFNEERFFDQLCEAVYKRAIVICVEDKRDEMQEELSKISDAESNKYSLMSEEYCDLLGELGEFEESADACEWKLEKMLSGIIEDITEKLTNDYYIAEGHMYDKESGKKVAKCFNTDFEFGEFDEYEKWRSEKNAEE